MSKSVRLIVGVFALSLVGFFILYKLYIQPAQNKEPDQNKADVVQKKDVDVVYEEAVRASAATCKFYPVSNCGGTLTIRPNGMEWEFGILPESVEPNKAMKVYELKPGEKFYLAQAKMGDQRLTFAVSPFEDNTMYLSFMSKGYPAETAEEVLPEHVEELTEFITKFHQQLER